MRRCIVDFVAFAVFELNVMACSEMSETSRVRDLHCYRPRIDHSVERCCSKIM